MLPRPSASPQPARGLADVAQQVVGSLDLAHHAVEGVRQLAELVPRPGPDRDVEIVDLLGLRPHDDRDLEIEVQVGRVERLMDVHVHGARNVPHARDERFADFWAKRARLRGRYRSLIKDASRAGRVVDLPIEMVTDLVFGAVEATMTWSEVSRRTAPARIADAVAAAAVRGVLLKPPSAPALRAAAARLR